jgi:hypothetical protein
MHILSRAAAAVRQTLAVAATLAAGAVAVFTATHRGSIAAAVPGPLPGWSVVVLLVAGAGALVAVVVFVARAEVSVSYAPAEFAAAQELAARIGHAPRALPARRPAALTAVAPIPPPTGRVIAGELVREGVRR